MRDSGYKNAAYAIAELIDNAVQAGGHTIELLCAEKQERVSARVRKRISQVAVIDDGTGMDRDTLRMALQFGNGTRLGATSGIGRFGMGLPNSSISQAQRVEVWSWQDGHDSAIYTYLDVDEIESGALTSVPEPTSKPVPDLWLDAGHVVGSSGTLVVWSKLDRMMWRTAKAIIDNSELLVGRMYRYFLGDDEHPVNVRFTIVDLDADAGNRVRETRDARPNDPLYLMRDTSCPYDGEPMFTQGEFVDTPFVIEFNGQSHTVTVRFSYAKPEVRSVPQAGSLPYGQHARKNAGVSIVRADRELDLDTAWTDPSDPRDRWWGVEVEFPPSLDDLFGVTNNKQYARNFSELARMDLESLVPEGQSFQEALDELDADGDPRLPLARIAEHIRSNISVIRRLLKAQTSGTRSRHGDEHEGPEDKGTHVARARAQEGYVGASDREEEGLSEDQRRRAIEQGLVEGGTPEPEAAGIAARMIERNSKYKIITSSSESPAFFDVRLRGGAIVMGLNVNHPAYSHLIEVLSEDDLEDVSVEDLRGRLHAASEGLQLLLMAWARYEDEQPDGVRRDAAQEARWSWGKMAKLFLSEDN
jgi:hypothetical protein